MAKKQKKDTKIKIKKKVWYNVVAPKSFNHKEIGETYLENPDKGLNRKMTVSLKDLTGSMRDQNVQIQLKLSEVKGTSLHTIPIGYNVVSTFVKRLVRKRTSRLDDVFTLNTKNGKPVVLKMLIVTYGHVNKSMATTLRMKVRSLMQDQMQKTDFETLVSSLVSLKIQSPIKRTVNKFFPIKEVLVRSAHLVDEDKARRVKESVINEVVDNRVKVESFEEPLVNVDENKDEAAQETTTESADDQE
ncbi:hypothetical protein HOC01_03080 [archaeon]|jgi:small subunit ribosomal protein S3Ae|nr:hypothetical protein [archaeon]MBT6698126.1 hypothetical protein [archaeon]